MMEEKSDVDAKYCPVSKCRWNSSGTFRLILCGWMINEVAVVFGPGDLSHNGFYIHGMFHILGFVLVGMPLVYSEVCIAQYTNCNSVSMWNYFPLFRGVGYGSLYLVLLKSIYSLVLASWYLEYTFYSALDPPPWSSCEEFNDTSCMVKRLDVPKFQHCLEMQNLYQQDCNMKTASHCFFDREIGHNSVTSKWPSCMYKWKLIVICSILCISIFVLSIKSIKILQVVIKFLALYLGITMLLLFCTALSTTGSWFSVSICVNWANYNVDNCLVSVSRGFLSTGTGSYIILYLSRDTSFRSHTMMTAVSASLISLFVTSIYALIVFSSIKTMSFFHGEEENVIEIGESIFFNAFASIAEILSYLNFRPLLFLWYSSIFFCIFVNEWILYIYLKELLLDTIKSTEKYVNILSICLLVLLCVMACPFYCSDLTPALTDSIQVIETISSLFFSVSLYWFYGFRKHTVDIVFMTGIKASLFWKITWILNPIIVTVLLFILCRNLYVFLEEEDVEPVIFDNLLFYVLLGIYLCIIFLGMVIEIVSYFRATQILNIFYPCYDWGPRDKILFKSRKMFVPQIMTRDFLYRQVRIHGYNLHKRSNEINLPKNDSDDCTPGKGEWNTLTSN